MMITTDGHSKINASQIDEAAVSEIVANCGLLPLTARVLVARGIDTPRAVNDFLSPSLSAEWHDPSLIPGLMEVADKVEQAIRLGKRILIFGDFDADGITATAVSVCGLRDLGADVCGFIPHRFEEGYALSEKALARAMQVQPDLVVTVDCGISCAQEVSSLLDQGVDVAITDHHEPGTAVPQGVPVADPKLDSDCVSRELAGAGVALKLICVLGERFGKPDLWREYTDLASLGTIGDLMELRGENRALVADGIQRMNNNPRTCLLALAAVCNVEPGSITSTRLSFSIIPRLNAAGRMGDAGIALSLLTSESREEAEILASELEAVNVNRRAVEAELTVAVEEKLARDFHGESVIVVAGEGWHEGVKGIVASRIARKYKRPAFVLTIKDGVAHGSGRTYGDVSLFELASRCAGAYTQFGGHAAAIGITVDADGIDALRDRFCAELSELEQAVIPSGIEVDAIVRLSDCDVAAFDELDYLQPFGNGNPAPLLAVENVFLEKRGVVGKGGTHLRFNASDGVSTVAGIYFNAEDIDELAHCEAACDVIFEPNVDEWQGRYTAKLMTSSICMHAGDPDAEVMPIACRVDELFEHESEISETGEYAGITRLARFNTKVVGVSFENRQAVLSTLETGVELRLTRQPHNEMDHNAIAVELLDGTQLGFLNRHLAQRLAPVIDEGVPYDAAVSAVTGGPAAASEGTRDAGPLGVRDPGVVSKSYGVNILVRRNDIDGSEESDAQDGAEQLAEARARWSQVAPQELDESLKKALIGDHDLHEAQAKTLANLAAGASTLTVMATGRGKSLIFHLHAARTALKSGKASIFIYPLRALVADQAFHLTETFSKFGLEVRVLTGETDTQGRAEVFEGLAQGSIDVILTTPEFLSIHADKFAATGRVGFLVVDEAHHVGMAKAGNRPAYAALSQTLHDLGDPLVLAVTATAGDEESRLICSTLSITELVLDPTVRKNLHIDDRRDLRDRENYLAGIVAGGGKCVAYVNSRDQSIKLTRMLRRRLPALASRIAFYNAGLTKADRKSIEEAFREGDLVCIISTSAFGEGIDIPDVEHVVLYHLPFNDIEFNQMSGRAGRDGRDATVHLLYSYGDARINEKILSSSAPTREQMIALYRVLKQEGKFASEMGEDSFSCTNSELAAKAGRVDRRAKLDDSAVSCGVSVFRELGFLETQGKSVSRRIRMVEGPQHMELADSVRYREGQEEFADFVKFKKWALGADEEDLLKRFNRPILPLHPEVLLPS